MSEETPTPTPTPAPTPTPSAAPTSSAAPAAASTAARPTGITILAILAGIAGLFEIWRTLVFLGIAKFTFIGTPVQFENAQWGQAIWALLLAAIWFWVAMGLWNMRAYAWSFGIYISLSQATDFLLALPRA